MADPFKKRPEDFVNQITRSAVGTLPVIGGVLKDWLPYVIGDPAKERRDDFMIQLAERVIALEKKHDALSPENLKVNEQFNAAFMDAAQSSLRTASAEKKRMLQNAVLNTAIWTVDETRRHIFMQLIDRLTPAHVELLAFLDAPKKNDAAVAASKSIMMGSLSSVVQAAIPELTKNREIFDRIAKDLFDAGLTGTGSMHAMMSGGESMLQQMSTPLGRAFLMFVSDPEKAPDAS